MKKNFWLLLIAMLTLQACGRAENPSRQDARRTASDANTIDPIVIENAIGRVTGDLNQGPADVTNLLRQAVGVQAFPIDALRIEDAGETASIAGWAIERGLVIYLGDQYGRHLAALAPTLSTADLDAAWYGAKAGSLRDLRCRAGSSLNDMTCVFVLPVTVTLTPAGAKFLGSRAPEERLYAVSAQRSGSEWAVGDLVVRPDQPPLSFLEQLLGPAETRTERDEAAVDKWAQARVEGDQAEQASGAQ